MKIVPYSTSKKALMHLIENKYTKKQKSCQIKCIGSVHGEHLPVKILTLSISQLSWSF